MAVVLAPPAATSPAAPTAVTVAEAVKALESSVKLSMEVPKAIVLSSSISSSADAI